MNAKEIFQNQVLEDVKSIVRELSQIQSFSGLLAHQQKIQSLYEKYIFLKQLSTSKYQQILDNKEIEGTIRDIPETKTEEKEFYDFQKQENIEKEEKIIQEEEKVKDTAIAGKKDEVERLEPLNIEIAKIKPVEREKKLSPIKLDFNDSIAFISQLFNGNKADMDAEFKVLNETHTIEDAKKWIEEMFIKYDWKNKEEFVERLSGLIVHRFES
jgi:hypothetical protein